MRWDIGLLSLHVIADFLIAVAYFSIPAALVVLVQQRRDVNFGFLFWLFSAFIFSCGLTHVFEIYNLWFPNYWISGSMKLLTGIVSVATAIVLWNVIPQALRIPTQDQMAKKNAQLLEELKKRQDAELGNRLKDDFLAILSHELRTPLNAILGWTQLLESGQLPREKEGEAIKVIGRNARSQAQLINDLLDLSGIGAGKIQMERTPLDVREVVDLAVASAQPEARARGVQIESVYGDPQTGILGDPKRLQQVVWNLLTNAIKFTGEGGLVEVTVERKGTRVLIIIRDNGLGIAPEFLPHVFEKFRQAEGGNSRSRGGMGIGLSLARELVLLHGGEIRAESRGIGHGAVFTVELPGIVGVERLPEPANPAELPDLKGVKILVVDDDADARQMTGEACRRAGAEVVVCSGAREALAEVQLQSPDVVVSDLAMPGEDGLWFIHELRRLRDPTLKNIPAVALSALAREEDRRKALLAGFQEHIAKPVDLDGLLRTLAGLLPSRG